ncbi:MAG TPA: hypothetical protein VE444_06320 [Gaiellaceae bacterium]|nr:hypothetical protein [Gaiellaceae bacterium]
MRNAAAGVCAAIALVSTLMTLPDTWSWLSEQHDVSAELSDASRFQAAGFNNRLPVGGFDFFRTHVKRGDRVYVLARAGTSTRGVDFPTAARTFARYYLLPAIVVDDPADATVIVTVARDPRELGLRYTSVLEQDGGTFTVARVSDPA